MKQEISLPKFNKGNETKPIQKSGAVNVIYFTNKCNLACTYCYEDLANRPPQIMNRVDIHNYVDMVLERENNDTQTLFVLFGGEVTLEWDNACYLMEYAYSKKKNVIFNLETNGIKFLSDKFLKEVMDNPFYRNGLISTDISFDGIGNQDRIFHNGLDSTSTMIKIFKKLDKVGFKYRIRYTLQKNNIDHFVDDIKNLMKAFKPLRIITSVAWSTLSEKDKDKLMTGREVLRKDWINKTINIPVCELFCDMCNGCGVRKELKTYFSTEGNVASYDNYENTPTFDHFKDKEKS